MTANVQDERKTEAQRKAQRSRQQRENPRDRRGRVARQLVGDWPPEQRARIRADLLKMVELEYALIGVEVLGSPEMQVIALIDKINEEEQVA